MKIKNIDDLSLDECKECLQSNPKEQASEALGARMDEILEERSKRKSEEIQKARTEQEKREKDVKWIDVKQFLDGHKYHNLSIINSIIWAVLLLVLFPIMAGIFYVEIVDYKDIDTHYHYKYESEYVANTRGIERFLLETDFIGIDFKNNSQIVYHYDYNIIDTNILIWILFAFLCILALFLIRFFHSPSLRRIYNIEQEEKVKSYRRTQNRVGRLGLHQYMEHRIIQKLPFDYDNIYYCGGNAFVCVKGEKRGVYNALKNKMVINVDYDMINIMPDGTLEAIQNGICSKFTTEGYRVIE